MPERVEVDKLSFSNIQFGQTCSLIIILFFLFIIGIPTCFIISGLFLVIIFIIFIISLIIILTIFNCKSKIELTKDKYNNKLTIIEQNCLCCKKILNLPLETTVLTAKYYGVICSKQVSTILALNIDPNAIDLDLDKSTIRNTPFKFIYNLTNVNAGKEQLELQLNNLSETKFKNDVKEEIFLYNPKPKFKMDRYSENFDYFHDKFFVKISDHFYMFYTYPFLIVNKNNETFERLDWMYTKDFDRIFIGVVKDDSSYINNFIFNTDTIDKFVFEKFDEYFCLKIILKTGERTEICKFLKELKLSTEIFIKFINGQINKINNVNQVITDNSAPTIK
jgi:hypothetical protein